MGKFKRYFVADSSEGVTGGEKKNVKSGDDKKEQGKLKVKTIVASSKPRKFNIKDGKILKKKSIKRKDKKRDDPFPKKAPVPKHQLKRYDRGEGLDKSAKKAIKTPMRAKKIIEKDKKIKSSLEQAARAELLLLESSGGVEVEDWEHTLQLKQCDLEKHVDVATATKQFELRLDKFGPYSADYTLNGRYLTLGGRKGHIAAFDWVTKRLLCEVNVRESVHDVKWLHNETLFAVAQKEWTYVYDNQGIEVHCLKKLDRVHSLDFLPYHFLLVAGHQSGFLSWVDVSIGKIVAQYRAKSGPPPSLLTTNPANAVTFCGHSNGTVSLWAPSVKEPLATVLCHGSPVSAIAIDSVGRLMATGAYDGTLRIWDLRNNYAPLTSTRVGVPSHLRFSQRGLLSVSTANQVMIFSELGSRQKPYLKHTTHSHVTSLKFCPFEDILGIGSYDGFQSILVPGSGEANYDALERNPYETKQQRREAEVKSLLDKIQPELISLDNSLLGEIDTETLAKANEEKPHYIKKADIELSHRKKRKNAKLPKIKEGLRAELTVKQARAHHQQAKQQQEPQQPAEPPKPFDNPLDRFRVQKKRK